jgi:predicted DNA-binding ribbon-helix-helix protein
MTSPVVKRSTVIAGHKTSVSLEDGFWIALKEIAVYRQMTLSGLVMSVDLARQHKNLSSCLRLFVLEFYQTRLAERSGVQTPAHEIIASHPADKSG